MKTFRFGRTAALALLAASALNGAGAGQATAVAVPEAVLYDDTLVAVGAAVPEFAGFWVDEAAGTLVVTLTRPGDAAGAAARGEIARLLGRPDLGDLRVVVRPARYSFGTLKGWHDAVSPEALALPGAVLTDVDERRNVVRVGVEDVDRHGPAVAAVAAAHGVPANALVIERAEPVVPDSSLRDVHRPAVGGLEIGFARPSEPNLYLCTFGFPAIRGGVQGFVTNSHCTATRGVVESTLHTQASVGAPIGIETADPAHFTGGVCPAGRACRRSDSAFSTLPVAALYNRGFIARPALGSYAWDGTSTFRITSEAAPVLGETLTRVGRTTGRGAGAVGATCTNYNVAASSLTMICQGQAAYGSAGGDSGSPVFGITSGTNVALKGVHWGSSGVFSPIGNIQLGSELGSLTTCAVGWSC